MDYKIRRNTSELNSTGFIEIGPGKYSGKHWQDGSLYVWEDAFGVAEGIVMKYFNDYTHFGFNNLPKEIGTLLLAKWREVALGLKTANEDEYLELLNLDVVYRANLTTEVAKNKESIIELFIDMANAFEQFYEADEWVCILGV